MNPKMKQTRVGDITRSLNIVAVGVLLTLIGFVSSSRVANAAYSDPNCRDHNSVPVPGADCPEGAEMFPAPIGRTQCASGINGSTNVCCSYTEYVTTCRLIGQKMSYYYELSASYTNSYCSNGNCLSWGGP